MSNDIAVEGFIYHYFLWKEKQALDLESSIQRQLEPDLFLPPPQPAPYNAAATSNTFPDPVVGDGNNNNNNVVTTATILNSTTNTSTETNPFLLSVKYRKVIQILSHEFPHLPFMYPSSMASRTPEFYTKLLLWDGKNGGDVNATSATTNQPRRLEPPTSTQSNDNTHRKHRKRDREEDSDYEEDDDDEDDDEGNDTGNNISNNNKSFAYYYRRLQIFQKKHGHCQVPKPRFLLYKWLEQLQLEYERFQQNPILQSLPPSKLTPDRIELLNQVHSGWWKRRHQTNHHSNNVETLTADTTGQQQLNTSTNATTAKKKRNRPARKMKWSERYEQLVQYYEQFGHTKVPRQDQNYRALGEWAHTQRMIFRQKLLPAHQFDLLNKIHFLWDYKQHPMMGISPEIKTPLADAILRVPFQERYQQCQEYCNVFGDLNIPFLFEKNMDGSNPTEEQQNFRFWAQCVRYEYEQNNIRLKNEQSKMSTTTDNRNRATNYKRNPSNFCLNQNETDKLTELGFVWVKDSPTVLPTTTTTEEEGSSNINKFVTSEERFDQRVEQIRVILEYFGHCCYPNIRRVYAIDHFSIFEWIKSQRAMYRRRYIFNKSSSLTDERQKKLENIHFIFDPRLLSTKGQTPHNQEKHNIDDEVEEEMEGYC